LVSCGYAPIKNPSTFPTTFTVTVGAGLVPALLPAESPLTEEIVHKDYPGGLFERCVDMQAAE